MILKWRFNQGDVARTVTVQKFLRLQGFTKSQLARVKFAGGGIYVNHRQRYSNYVLHDGQVIRVVLPPDVPTVHMQRSLVRLDIVYEDQWCLVVAKPAAVASIPSYRYPVDTMANRVLGYLAEAVAAHPVTRLDRYTTGLMLFAKNAFAHGDYDHQLKHQTLHKTYLAVITGVLPQVEGDIRLPLKSESATSVRQIVSSTGKSAWTHYRVLATQAEATFVEVELRTGRTHQIRAHFAALGHPLLGDDLYGGQHDLIQRQALHCYHLEFEQVLTHQPQQLTLPVPSDFLRLLNQLGLTQGLAAIKKS